MQLYSINTKISKSKYPDISNLAFFVPDNVYRSHFIRLHSTSYFHAFALIPPIACQASGTAKT
jgi:hypothetical protein